RNRRETRDSSRAARAGGPLAPPYRHARPQRGRAVHARWHQRGDPRPRRGLLKRVVTIRSSVSRSAKRASATSELEIPTQGPKFLIGVASYPTPRPCACDAHDRALHTLHSWRKVGNWWTSTASNLTEVGRRPMNPARPARPRNLPPRQRFCLLLRFLSLDMLPPGAIGVRNELPRAGLCHGCLDGQRDRLARHVLCLDEVALGLTDFRQFDPQQRVVGFDPEGALDRTGGDRVVLGGELDVRLIDEGARGRTKHGLSTGRLWQRFGRLHRRRRRAGSSFY